jgi:hypothetical protein
MGGMTTAGSAKKKFAFLAATHVRCCYLHRGGLAKALMLDEPVKSPPAWRGEHPAMQKVIGRADSGLSQMTGVGGVDSWIAVGAYHDLDGDVNRRPVDQHKQAFYALPMFTG